MNNREMYAGQMQIFDPYQFVDPIHIIGMGGIGSNVLPLLLREGFGQIAQVHIWDDDTVEIHNLPGQNMYRPSDIGHAKVDAALAYTQRQEYGANVVVHREKVGAQARLSGVVIMCVDSMTARREVLAAVVQNATRIPICLDGRIGGEQWELYTFAPFVSQELRRYQQTLLPDDEVEPLPCAARTCLHPSVALAAHIAGHLTHFAREKPSPWRVIEHMGTDQFLRT